MRQPLTIRPLCNALGHTVARTAFKMPDLSKTIDDVPGNLLAEWSFKLYALCNLAWDYVDTLCDQCIIMGLNETKPLVRTVRGLRREYEKFRAPFMTDSGNDFETEHGLRFEEYVRADFKKFMNSIEAPINRLDLKDEHRQLVIAAHRCMAVLDAIKEYARWCDRQIKSYGVWACDCCMVQQEVLALYPLIPQFAGDCWQSGLEGQTLTSAILVNRLMSMPLHELLDSAEIEIVND